jgi:4-hydroxy-tetrahydrodipicolinate reductase
MKNLSIVGYGKMGRLIEQLAPQYDFEIHSKLDLNDDLSQAAGADVAIEFTSPHAVAANVEKISALGIPLVVGTTGWASDLDRVRAAIASNNSALVWSPNFSVGVNIFARLVHEAARLFKDQPEYGAWAWEIHHITKKDAPSGTLIKLVDEMKAAGFERSIDAGSSRAGAHPGTHEIGFDSLADTITLRHTARSREGFARGALKAAQWIIGKKGFFDFADVLFK